jgi:hypothetical protein
MGKSSEEFIRQREGLQESIPLIGHSFNWENYFSKLGEHYNNKEYEKRDI